MPYKQTISIQTKVWILLLLISGILAAIAYYSFSQHAGGILAESGNTESFYDYSEQQNSAADNKTLEESLVAELNINLRIFYIFIAALPLLLVIWFAIKFFKKRKENNEENRKFPS